MSSQALFFHGTASFGFVHLDHGEAVVSTCFRDKVHYRDRGCGKVIASAFFVLPLSYSSARYSDPVSPEVFIWLTESNHEM
jgi:hypothetical protein